MLKLVIDSNGDVVDGSDANGDTQGEKGVTFARLLAPLPLIVDEINGMITIALIPAIELVILQLNDDPLPTFNNCDA